MREFLEDAYHLCLDIWDGIRDRLGFEQEHIDTSFTYRGIRWSMLLDECDLLKLRQNPGYIETLRQDAVRSLDLHYLTHVYPFPEPSSLHINNTQCKFFDGNLHLRCAVNPMGKCDGCKDFEPRGEEGEAYGATMLYVVEPFTPAAGETFEVRFDVE